MHKLLKRVWFWKQFDRNEHFSPFELSWAGIKISVWINSARLNWLKCLKRRFACFLHVNRLGISKGKFHTVYQVPRENNYSFLHLLHFHRLTNRKKLLSWNPRPTRGAHKTNRVKERVFHMSCFDRFNETEPLWWNKSKCSAHFFSYLTTLYRKYVLREIVWPSIACSQIILRGSWKKLHANKFFVTRCPPSIGSLRDLITWSTFGKHENSSFLKNFISTGWKSILKSGNLRIFSRISQKQRLQRQPIVGSICTVWETTFAIQSCLHAFPYKSL